MKSHTILLLAFAAIAATLLFTTNSNDTTMTEFVNFKLKFNKNYSPIEESYRLKIFSDNLIKINLHNADPTQTYQMGITPFADLSTEEFVDKPFVKRPVAPRPTTNAADQVDWRTANKLNTVKNQGQCGSCWAFSTTGTLEAAVAIATGKLKSFSEQQLVDCCGSKGYECEGCNGAWPEWALNYINKEGIVLETEYPYTARGGVCKSVPTAQKYLNSAKPWTMIAEADLKEWISHEPVSVCVDASNWSLYKSGVFSNCGSTNLNHAVVAIGYNVAVADKYLLIRNSWGTAWGENGHIRLKEGNNTCGVGSHALVANLS